MSRVLTRSQLGRVTRWVRTHQHPSSSVRSTRWIPFSTAKVRPFSRNKRELPEDVVRLKCSSYAKSGVCKVYLVGIVHRSQKSCEEVRSVIRLLKPEVVFLELCASRRGVVTNEPQKEPTMKEMLAMILKKKPSILGLHINGIYVLAIFNDANKHKAIPYYKMPGAEFKVAYEEVRKYGGKVAYGDRPIQITLLRALRKRRPLLEKIKLLSFRFRKDGSRLKEALKLVGDNMNMDMATQFTQELGKVYPTLVETVVHERDLYMSAGLLEAAQKSSCVVAVVGKGHVEGIKKHWQQPVSVQDLLTVPPPRRTAKILTSVGVVVVGAAMFWRYL